MSFTAMEGTFWLTSFSAIPLIGAVIARFRISIKKRIIGRFLVVSGDHYLDYPPSSVLVRVQHHRSILWTDTEKNTLDRFSEPSSIAMARLTYSILS